MTADEAKRVLEKAKLDLPSWEVVMNPTYSDETVREGVLFNLLKLFYRAAGSDADVMRRSEETFEEAIGRFVLTATGSYYPSRSEIDDLVETAFSLPQTRPSPARLSFEYYESVVRMRNRISNDPCRAQGPTSHRGPNSPPAALPKTPGHVRAAIAPTLATASP